MTVDSASAALIRARIEALPEELRHRWWARQGSVMTGDHTTIWPFGSAYYLVADADMHDETEATGFYIAGMDPTVGAALADLLDAEAEVREWDTRRKAWCDAGEMEPWAAGAAKADIRRGKAFDALEAAILRTERTGQ